MKKLSLLLIAFLCSLSISAQGLNQTEGVDLSASWFKSPITNYDLGQETVTVVVANNGSVDVESFEIAFSIDDVTIATETVNQTIKATKELEYTFTAKADLSKARTRYSLKAWTKIADDKDSANDTCFVEVYHKVLATVPYSMGFEENEYTDDIKFFNLNNDGGAWTIFQNNTEYQLSRTGERCLSYVYSPSKAGDDWAIIEPISIEEAGYYELKFWCANLHYPEKLKICYGNEAKPEAMTNEIRTYPNINVSGFKTSTNVIYIEEPQTIYIGFYAFSDADMNYLRIDDLTLVKTDKDGSDKVGAAPTKFEPMAASYVTNKFESFVIMFDKNNYPKAMDIKANAKANVYDAAGDLVTTGTYCYADEENYNIKVTFAEAITEAGTYTVKVAEGDLKEKETGKLCPAFDVNYTVVVKEGIEEVFSEVDEFTVYTVNGVCVLRNATSDEVKQLESGLYIINGKKVFLQ